MFTFQTRENGRTNKTCESKHYIFFCHLPVLLQVVAEVWMEVVAYPGKQKEIN